MKVFIAEKPSLGRAIAEGLGITQKSDGYIKCGNDIVTWCFGHLLDSAPPEHYNAAFKAWKREHLPIIPPSFKLLPQDKTKSQIALIKKLVSQCGSVVNAGDPDREGQLLVDEVLEHISYKGKCERIWLASLDPASVKKALSSLKSNEGYRGFRDAADARRQMDWLAGMNLTRAMTLFGRSIGMDGVLSLGRVQTPALALIVERDLEIENFKPVDYAALKALIKHQNGTFWANLIINEDMQGADRDGRLVNFVIAEALRKASENLQGKIVNAEAKKGKEAPPLPYALSTLQKDASAQLNLGAQQTLSIAQKLYEAKLTTYPRTDCGYLPEEQFGDAGKILKSFACIPELAGIAGNAKPALKSAAWNTKKVTAHHGIIPTGMAASKLSGAELDVYLMIARRYIAQFYPPLEYKAASIEVELANKTRWLARGRVITSLGWKVCAKGEQKENELELPQVAKGDNAQSGKVEIERKQTKPPARFNEGSLIEAMSGIHKYVKDQNAKARLKETSGLGTEATRAAIIETLKKRGYITAKGKALISTETGRNVIALCPETIKDIVTTALMEDDLADIQAGHKQAKAVVASYAGTLGPMIDKLFTSDASDRGIKVETHACPVCGRAMGRRKGKAGFFWGCSGYPDCNCMMTDAKGKPGEIIERKAKAEPPVKEEFKCPLCKGKLTYGISKAGKPYWACFAKSSKHGKDKKVKFFNALADGKPDI